MSKRSGEIMEQAKAMYLKGMKLIEISKQLDLPEGTVRRWKCTHKWENERSGKKTSVRKRGGQPGNKNATGPPGNQNARKHGLFSRYLPIETLEILEEMSKDPLDIMWHQIQIAYAAILRAQKIMYVIDSEDSVTVDTDNGNMTAQYAWDRQASFLASQAKAQSELRSMIKQYDELLHKNWELATEEQKARIEAMKAQTEKATRETAEDDDDGVVIINDAPKG